MITLEEAKSHLRVISEDEDADITLKMKFAVAIVNDLTGEFCPTTQQADDIKDAATLLVLGEFYANREANAELLSPSVKAILERLRSPVFA